MQLQFSLQCSTVAYITREHYNTDLANSVLGILYCKPILHIYKLCTNTPSETIVIRHILYCRIMQTLRCTGLDDINIHIQAAGGQ